ncbi:ligase-associated DNA damage response endonuclease PdeM [Cesiribacter sp. SM1]|uniref:ligase-associated DNA damage response endonuclease PdeM n=1 Tax=Cesiribacter sp. SM1 TaxID=2861196 RepID=UPI001CD76954|nr:ligase-associated DNA damage response endonuclease PdeM [Cesiribacter sp. SM1]
MQQEKSISPTIHTIAGQELLLLPEKAIFWTQKKILLLADLHLGKAAHFRKAGIPISGKIHEHDLHTLDNLLNQWQPLQVIFLGDLFHSSFNQEWNRLEAWMEEKKNILFTLIRGNHDVLPRQLYAGSCLQVVDEKMEISPFLLTHHPPEEANSNTSLYTLCGHVHPAIQLSGQGRQQLSLPCFYFGLHYGILPAFGKFTGFYKIKPKAGEQVYGVLPERVIPLGS